jgi:hypothetical protein
MSLFRTDNIEKTTDRDDQFIRPHFKLFLSLLDVLRLFTLNRAPLVALWPILDIPAPSVSCAVTLILNHPQPLFSQCVTWH